MLKNRFKIVAVIAFGAIMFDSCKQKTAETVEPVKTSNSATEYKPNADNKIVLGKQLENPYTVENMRKAYASLSSNARVEEDASPVRTTHLYVRFLPKDWAQYDTLVADTSLELYNIPLDHEVAVCGNFYHDPSIPEDKPTWQYTSVPVDFKFNPSIQHEVISELYIPEQDPSLLAADSNARKAIDGKSFTNALLDEAMILTKNFDDTLKTNPSGRIDWFPNGTMTVLDTRLGVSIPLEGVKIRVRRWVVVKIAEATTNVNGFYQTSGFDRPVSYSLIFETPNFDVRTGTFGQATVEGPKQSSPWSVNFWVNDVNRFYCHVFRGAWRYHYGNIDGMTRPQNMGLKIKYAAFDKHNDGTSGVNIGNWSLFRINPNILIYRFVAPTLEYASDEVFSTVIHETAHGTHMWRVGEVHYLNGGLFIYESWATAAEWHITNLEYRGRGIANYGREDYTGANFRPALYGLQHWPLGSLPRAYSSVFIDINDNFNQNGVFFNGRGTSTINDQVTGYSMAFIESTILREIIGVNSLRESLKRNRQGNTTDIQIDNLLVNFP